MTVDELFDYMNCPLHHYFKYVNNIPDLSISKENEFRKTIDTVIKSFYYRLMDEKFLNPNELKTVWQTVCESSRYEIDAKDAKRALTMLSAFHDWAKDNCGVAFDIDRECLIPVGDNKVSYKIPLVRQKFDKTIDILHLKHWNSTIDLFKIETDISFPLSVLAFNNVYESLPETVSVFNSKTSKEIVLRFDKSELARVQSTIDNIFTAVASGIRYPRWNIYCNSCSYKPQCKAWRG